MPRGRDRFVIRAWGPNMIPPPLLRATSLGPHPRNSPMSSPSDCRYSETHEWFRQSGNTVTMGITQHAADALTDVTYVQAKGVGTAVAAGGSVGEVESVKTTSEVYAAFAGTIAAVNDEVVKDPSLINSDPYGKGWICKLTVAGEVLGSLMDAKTYDAKNGH